LSTKEVKHQQLFSPLFLGSYIAFNSNKKINEYILSLNSYNAYSILFISSLTCDFVGASEKAQEECAMSSILLKVGAK